MNFLDATKPTARKDHQCSTCSRKIDPGEKYYRQRGFDGGDAWTFRMCVHCLAASDLYDPRDMNDNISEDGFDGWADDQPRDVAEARAMAGWKHHWRTQTGKPWPLPALTEALGADR